MRNLMDTYVERFRKERGMQRRLTAILLVLAVVVAGGVFWQLRYTGIALANETACGLEEHQHDENCFETVLTCGQEEPEAAEGHAHEESCYETVQTLICGLEEDDSHTHDDSCYTEEEVLICELSEEEAVEGHVHEDSCYEEVLVCEIPEHIHTAECLMDQTADAETKEEWEASLPGERTGVWADDVVAVAQSQLGYTESQTNFQVAEDGETRQGYTRYGAWYGNEYGDWDAMFVSFCLHYAGVPESEFPEASGAYAWVTGLNKKNLYADAADYTPTAGDLIFFDTGEEADGKADRVGIVEAVKTQSDGETAARITVIEGDCGDAVCRTEYEPDLKDIVGYGILPEPEEIFTITYSSEEPEAIGIEGPEESKEGEDLVFTAVVDLNSGYDIAEATVNGEEQLPEKVTASEDGWVITYEYRVEDVEEDLIVFFAAKQVIDGSGSLGVYQKAAIYPEQPDYTLTVSEVPTNTKISLDSAHLTLTDSSGEKMDETLAGALYYHPNSADDDSADAAVAYLILDGDPEDGSEEYAVTPYDENDTALEVNSGIVILDTSKYVRAVVSITPIQTETLCYEALPGNAGNEDYSYSYYYADRLIGAMPTGTAQSYETVGMAGDVIDLTEITNSVFYYSTEELKTETDPETGYSESVNLTSCTQGKIVENPDSTSGSSYTVKPLDEEGRIVEEATLYLVSDQVYSFDILVNSIVNEHTEDNGDVYLWKGKEYYIDRYHNQGGTSNGYTNRTPTYSSAGSMTWDVGVWVQLAEIREEAVNALGASLKDYASVTYSEIEGSIHQNGTSKINTGYDYGIAGPYYFETETDVTQSFHRVTGHIGDEFVASDAIGSEIAYMMTDEGSQYHSGWVDLGAHASDEGTRSWWYWISDYYQLNNHEDELEYVEIVKDDDGSARLMADEMGTDGAGHEYDIWETMVLTKRDSVVKSYMMENQSTFKKDGMSFNKSAYLPHHIQLRMRGTVETVIDGEVYHGALTVVDGSKDREQAPYAEYRIWDAQDADGEIHNEIQGSSYMTMANEQEAEIYYFQDTSGGSTVNYYVPWDNRFDTEKVQIYIKVYFTGTLTCKTDPSQKYTFTDENPFEYEITLDESGLQEAYDTCPNSAGYDVSVNLSAALQRELEAGDVTLYKIWEDEDNRYGSRDEIDAVTVTLERSKDGYTYEDVPERNANGEEIEGTAAEFEIEKPEGEDTDVWSWTLTEDDLSLTYETDGGETAHYQFRIKVGSENLTQINNLADGYTYSASYSGLTVNNTLEENFVEISGVKIWQDAEGKEITDRTLLPDRAILAVYQEGQFIESTTVTAEENWSFAFHNLPKWKDKDTPFTYTLCELDADGTQTEDGDSIVLGERWYQVSIAGETDEKSEDMTYTVTNQLIPTADLPSAGGPGTKIFTLPGLLLVFGAGWLLYRNRKREVRKV